MIIVYLSLSVVVFWLIWNYIITPRSKQLPPGPKGQPVIGNLLQLDVNDMRTSFDVWAKKYGPIVFVKLFNVDAVVLSDPEIIRRAFCSPQYTKIINEKPHTFIGEYFFYGYRDVLFGMYTDTVMKTRTVMKKGLQMVDNMEALQEGGVKHLIDSLGETGGKDFDPVPYVSEAVGNIFSIMFTGETVSKEDAQLIFEFEEAANDIVHPAVEVMLTNFPWLRFLPGSVGNKYRRALDGRDRLLHRFHETLKASYVEGKTRGLVDVFIQLANQQAAEGDSAWFGETETKTSILDMIGAGFTTLFNGLNASFLTLLNHPEVANKMYEEVKREVGTSRFPCLEDRENVPYSTAVMFECLRYTTHVNIILPHRTAADWHFEGYVIPKDVMVLGNLWTIHHDEKYFPDPWTFRPERFLEPNGDLIPPEHPTRQAFIPYGLGRRQCVGSSFADGRLFLFLTSLVQNFTLSPPENDVMMSCDPHGYKTKGIVMGPKAYKCRVIPRDPRPG